VLLFGAAVTCAQSCLPTVEGETLAGKKVTLPGAFSDASALLIIGFTHCPTPFPDTR